MRIRKKPNLDFEVDRFHFRFRRAVSGVADKLRGLFTEWMREREAAGACACYFKNLSVEEPTNPKQADVLFGWFCERCLVRLEPLVGKHLPSITAVSVGSDLSPYPAPDSRFIHLSGAVAFFENGSSAPLAQYEICRSPVTTGQFDEFTAATGYVTACERDGAGSFRLDETMEPVRSRDRANIPVHSVSFNDALEYCAWANVRLPSEAELLAAALIDHRIMSPREFHDFMFGQSGRFDIEKYPDSLAGLGAEFVVGDAAPGKAIVRTGPYYVRETGWETQPYRHEWSTGAYDIMTGFRVCRTTTSARRVCRLKSEPARTIRSS